MGKLARRPSVVHRTDGAIHRSHGYASRSVACAWPTSAPLSTNSPCCSTRGCLARRGGIAGRSATACTEQAGAGHTAVGTVQTGAGHHSRADNDSSDGQTNASQAISFGETGVFEHDMMVEVVARFDDMARRSSRRKPCRSRLVHKGCLLADERSIILMREEQARRDASEVAVRCGRGCGPAWTAVWDNAGHTHVCIPRPKRHLDRRLRLTLRHEVAMEHLDPPWFKFRHEEETPARRSVLRQARRSGRRIPHFGIAPPPQHGDHVAPRFRHLEEREVAD